MPSVIWYFGLNKIIKQIAVGSIVAKSVNKTSNISRCTHYILTSNFFPSMRNISILVPRALFTRGATRDSGQIHIKLASDWLQGRLLF
jgi:hypothetical protein